MSMAQDLCIQSTNDSSCLSKISAASKGYYDDKFLKYFSTKSPCRSPLINRGYYIRFKAMEAVFGSWMNSLRGLREFKYQVISLGAGYDTTYFRLKKNGKIWPSCAYIEVDFPEVVANKCEYISRHEVLQDLISIDFNEKLSYCASKHPEIYLLSDDYFMLGIDLKEPNLIGTVLQSLYIEFDTPTLFLSECCISYLDMECSEGVIRWARDNFPNAAFVTYEQVYPSDGFGLVMQKHFNSINSPLKSVLKYPTLESEKKRFLDMGWNYCAVSGINDFRNSLPAHEKARLADLELFDEYEMWHMKCNHYAVVWASQGSISSVCHFPDTVPREYCQMNCPSWSLVAAPSCMQRYGHQVAKLSPKVCLISGGFGILDKKHCRLKDLSWHNLETLENGEVTIENDKFFTGSRIHHSMIVLSDQRIVIYGGRSAPKKPYDDILLLSPQQAEGSNLKYSCEVVEQKGKVPMSRWRHTCSLVTFDGVEHLFVFGGCTSNDYETEDCYVLNTETWTWWQVPKDGESPLARHSHSSAVNNGSEIIISGGLHKETPLHCIDVFDTFTQTWDVLTVGNFLPRYSHTSLVYQKQLIMVGGVSDIPGFVPFVTKIDLNTLIATDILNPHNNPEYPLLFCNHQSLTFGDQLMIVGGGGNCFSFGTHFNQQIIRISLEALSKQES